MDSSFDALMSAYKGAQDTDGMMCYACDAAPKKPQTLQQHLQRYHKGQMPKGDCSWLKQYKKDHPNWKAEAEKVTKAEEDVDTVKKDAKGDGKKKEVSKEVLERCDKKMSDEEVYALREMASDKNTPADVLKKLAFAEHYTSANANCEIQEAVANNPNTPNDILKHLSGFPHSNEDYKGKSYRNDVAESAKVTLAAKKKGADVGEIKPYNEAHKKLLDFYEKHRNDTGEDTLFNKSEHYGESSTRAFFERYYQRVHGQPPPDDWQDNIEEVLKTPPPKDLPTVEQMDDFIDKFGHEQSREDRNRNGQDYYSKESWGDRFRSIFPQYQDYGNHGSWYWTARISPRKGKTLFNDANNCGEKAKEHPVYKFLKRVYGD